MICFLIHSLSRRKTDENRYLDQKSWSLKGAKMVQVDGETIKEDTWYTMENGEIIEVKESEDE